VQGLAGGAVGAGVLWLVVAWLRVLHSRASVAASLTAIWHRNTVVPWRSMLVTASLIVLCAGWVAALWPFYHVFGTDQTGNDVLYQAMKSIRTAVVIGSLATLATLPFAIVFGILAGYYKGRVDDVIQYLYTMLSSIPSVLLIAAFVLMIQVFVDKNPQMFETALQRADIRLFLLATILGLTGLGVARSACCAPRRSSCPSSTTCRPPVRSACRTSTSCGATSFPTSRTSC
jgi:peptide/nickel transport system permease protein